ncbi:MAG: GNAT family N-acetyltransferase [Oscillospiraceae bacterium]|nr:GNAT family N-acetyltransferase [Oscillospiraceae bacterium]
MNIELRSGLNYREEIRALFDEYTKMLVDTNETFAEYLRLQKYDDEVEHLEHKYGEPDGKLYIAFMDDDPVGCVGLRNMGDGNCEMKRLYVRPDARHLGAGKVLVDRIIGDAERMGYSYMYLDTLPELDTAIRMYLERGFEIIEQYNDSPVDTTIYMRKRLGEDNE